MRVVNIPLGMALCGLLVAGCADQDSMDDMDGTEMPAPMEEAPGATVSLADFAGTWDATAYMESGDTVQYTMTATADATGWMIDLPDRDPMPARVTVDGDSVVTEMGPYESILREGVMVSVRTVSRLQNGQLVGTMEARYEGGDGATVVPGRVEATRGM